MKPKLTEKGEAMKINTFTIDPERLKQIEQAVGFEVNNNRDMDYAIELLCNAVMPKIAQRAAYAKMLKGMLE